METIQKLNLFIVDDDTSMVAALKHYLDRKFGSTLKISTFYDGESCLKKIDDQTHIVLLDYFLNGKNGLEVLNDIKTINPKTEVIMLSSHEDMATAIESFRKGAKDYIVKGKGSWQKILFRINRIIASPIKAWIREFGIMKFTIIFFIVFSIMAAVVIWALRLLPE
ncbi:MAG: response regulator [Bacteroidota bacterium]